MKKTLLSLFMLTAVYSANAQNLFAFGFDGTDAAMDAAGWARTNQSSPSSPTLWSNGDYDVPIADPIFGSTSPVGQTGGVNSFALVNYTSTTGGTGIISNWLITPSINVKNGDVISFWTRKGTDGTVDYADRLELRLSTAPATIVPSTGSSDVGTFTTVAVSVNPNLQTGFVYPKVWTKYSYTVTGMPLDAPVKVAFRYFVTSAGPTGTNSDIIGIDTFSVDRAPLSTTDFFSKNLSLYPNPSNGIVNLSSKNNASINTVEITDINGRVVKNLTTNGVTDIQINISDLTSGMYFLNIQTDLGSGTAKVIRN